jgi:pimeloyl-ACP methyl ester carboxylesterase
MDERSREVVSSDGVRLAVYESGPDDAPTVVAVHGYPDNHTLWHDVAGLLAGNFHVVTYDVRGAGASDKPTGRRAYRMTQLVDDLLAVIDTTSPARPVHLLGHDWGSIQLWPAVTDDRFAGRIASFTSISGPSLDYAGSWVRRLDEHPRESLRQFAHSYYIFLFQLPLLPEWAAQRGFIARGARRAGRPMGAAGSNAEDAVTGVQLYRANMLTRVSRPKPVPAQVPVQLVVPGEDAFARPTMVVEATTPWVSDLTVVPVSGGHWWFTERPDVLAGLIGDFAAAHPVDAPRDATPVRGGRSRRA